MAHSAGGSSEIANARQLTEAGREVSKEVGAQEWARSVLGEFAKIVEGASPYQVQQQALEFANGKLNSDQELRERAEAFAFSRGLHVYEYAIVLQLELRDLVLETRETQ